MSSSSDILDEFLCPVCFEYMHPPQIGECLLGHAFCTQCSKKMERKCPFCTEKIVYYRNSTLEKVHANLDFPCKYSGQGCKVRSRGSDLRKHQNNCHYRPEGSKQLKYLRFGILIVIAAVYIKITYLNLNYTKIIN